MLTSLRYEILDSLPTYGPMYIPVTESGEAFYSEGFVVKLYKTDGSEWVTNFQPGLTELKQVIELANTSNLLIIAYGTCYIMNPNKSIPILVFGGGYCKIFKASNYRHVLSDQQA